jgi:hypothetical protein
MAQSKHATQSTPHIPTIIDPISILHARFDAVDQQRKKASYICKLPKLHPPHLYSGDERSKHSKQTLKVKEQRATAAYSIQDGGNAVFARLVYTEIRQKKQGLFSASFGIRSGHAP